MHALMHATAALELLTALGPSGGIQTDFILYSSLLIYWYAKSIFKFFTLCKLK